MPVRYQFQPRPLTTLAAAAGIVLTLALANWQLDRAHEKEALAAQLDALAKAPPVALTAAEAGAGDLAGRRVTARGRFEPKHAVFLDNQVHRGVAGYHVVMPLAIEGGNRYVLVDRGWLAAGADRTRVPDVKTPGGTVEITGLAVTPGRRFVELSTEVAEGKIWQNLTLERYRQAVPIPLQPVVIRQESELGDGLVRQWDPPDAGVNTHYAYAVQWFAVAAAILAIYLVIHVRRVG